MKCPRCASEIEYNSEFCKYCGLIFEISKKRSNKKILTLIAVVVFLVALMILSVFTYTITITDPNGVRGKSPPKFEVICEKYENGYVIDIVSVTKKSAVFDLTYKLIDKNGSVIQENGVDKIYGIDFEFGNYNASSEPFRIKFHDNDTDGLVFSGDYFVIKTNLNLSGYKFKLIFEPTGTSVFEKGINANPPLTKMNVIEHDINNKWTITNSSANSTIEIDTNKTALSNYPAIGGQEIEILLTIYNKNNISANLTLNVSDYYYGIKHLIISSNMTNETLEDNCGDVILNISGKHPIPSNKSVIVKVSYRLPRASIHNISVEIFDKNSNSSLNASVSLKVSTRTFTTLTSQSFSISILTIFLLTVFIAIFKTFRRKNFS